MLGHWVLIERNQAQTYKLIAVPDSFKKASPVGRVLKIGPKVPKDLICPGDLVIEKSHSKWKKAHGITDSKTRTPCYIAPYGDIQARMFEGRVYPIGKRILVRRHLSEHKLSSVILSRDYNQENTQGLEVEVVRLGMTFANQPFTKIKGLKPGDRCKLQRWEQHMFEIAINEQYHLIVNEDDIEYRYEH